MQGLPAGHRTGAEASTVAKPKRPPESPFLREPKFRRSLPEVRFSKERGRARDPTRAGRQANQRRSGHAPRSPTPSFDPSKQTGATMNISSHPAGVLLCHACGVADSPTLTVYVGDDPQTVCDDCRRPHEASGVTSARAIELAISEAVWDGPGKVRRRDGLIRKIRRRIGQDKRQGEQLLAFDMGRGEQAEARRKARRRAA